MTLFPVLIFLCLVISSFERSTPQDDHYVAAVVEYVVSTNVNANRQNYETLIRQAAEQNADVVVFPELTLTNSTTSFSVPIHGLLQEFPVPAEFPDRYDDLLVAMSAAARNNQIYVVLNTRESVDCTIPQQGEECPEEKVYVFNTNVVFDRNGAVIDRYRKINLFGEATHTPALKPDLGVFNTDFGVTFGHYICFDLMFQVPAVQVVQKHNIKDIIFTTMWFSEMPYLTAVEIQESYAYTMDVNFLGSGANNVRVGSAGSGIYSGKAGALVSTMASSETRLLVARVPKVPGNVQGTYPGPINDNPVDQDRLVLIQDPSLPAHVTRPLVEGYQDFTIVDKDVTCRFQVRLTNRTNTKYHYRAAAFSGVRSFSGVRTGGMRACSVLACTGPTKNYCGIRFTNWEENSTALFEELTIIGTMPTPVVVPELEADDFVVFPLSLTSPIMPLETKDFTYNKNITGNVTIHTMSLTNSGPELYTFGLWGRIFETDGLDADPGVDDPVVEESSPPSQDGSPGAGWAHSLSSGLFGTVLAMFIYNH